MSMIFAVLLFLYGGGLSPVSSSAAAAPIWNVSEVVLPDGAPLRRDTLAVYGGYASLEEAVASQDRAEEKNRTGPVDDDRRTEFSGQVFAHYGWNATGTGATESFNGFALTRWYATVKTRLSDRLDFRGTTDVGMTDVGYTAFVKFAYVDWRARPGLSLRAGVHQTGWQSYVNKVWGYRGVAKTMAQQQGHVSMADLGATLTADLPAHLGQAAVGVLNGTGFRRFETDRFKDVAAQLRLAPFAGGGGALAPVRLAGHIYRGRYADERTRQRWGGLIAYDGAAYTLAVNYEGRRDGEARATGVSGFGTFRLAAVPTVGTFTLLGLVDVYAVDDPNGDPAVEAQRIRSIVGLAYQPADGLTLSLDYQRNHAEMPVYDRYDGTLTDVDASLYLHVIVNY